MISRFQNRSRNHCNIGISAFDIKFFQVIKALGDCCCIEETARIDWELSPEHILRKNRCAPKAQVSEIVPVARFHLDRNIRKTLLVLVANDGNSRIIGASLEVALI